MQPDMHCACGCGTRLHKGMYVQQITDRYYAQKCVRLVILDTATPAIGAISAEPAATQ